MFVLCAFTGWRENLSSLEIVLTSWDSPSATLSSWSFFFIALFSHLMCENLTLFCNVRFTGWDLLEPLPRCFFFLLSRVKSRKRAENCNLSCVTVHTGERTKRFLSEHIGLRFTDRMLADLAFRSVQRWFMSSSLCCRNTASSELPRALTIFVLFPSTLL